MDFSRLERLYIRRFPIYKRAAKRVKGTVGEMVDDFATDGLFRVALAPIHRRYECRGVLKG